MIINCVEDCHRFMSGQMEFQNTTSVLEHWRTVQQELREIKPLITPNLYPNQNYDWAGNDCENKNQKEFLQVIVMMHISHCQKKK